MSNHTAPSFPTTRLRRLRQHPRLRELVRETELGLHDLVQPLFINENLTENKSVGSMPGQSQLALNKLDQEIKDIVGLGIPAVLLFGIPKQKNARGSESFNPNGIIQTATQKIKSIAPDLLVIIDSCLCEYTDHGHCGTVSTKSDQYIIENDPTLEILTQQAITYAEAGADMIAPSGMMDGMIGAMRRGLDQEGYSHIPLMSYAAKYFSSLYGPFREASEGAPQFGNRSSYQMDPANSNEALREMQLDINEGADIIMVKPAINYLDIIYRAKENFPTLPLAAYQVSGEYAMIKAAAQNGWINEQQVMMESLLAMKRAGANFILTYFAKEAAKVLANPIMLFT
jgi:porphobilinogen synthase